MYKEIVFEKRHMSKREIKMVWIFFILINSLNIKKHVECLLLDDHIYYYTKWNGFSRSKLKKIGLFIQ